MTNAGGADNFPDNSASFKFKQKITDAAGMDSTKNVEIMVPLKYSCNFWRTVETPLTNCEINLILTLPNKFVISNAAENQATTFAICNSKLYVLVVIK